MKWVKEPLVHFLLLAVALFVLNSALSSSATHTIYLDNKAIDYLVATRESLLQKTLSEDEKKQLIDAYVEEEILYAEAYKRGLDKSDARIRRSLIRQMRSLLVADTNAPSDSQLREYYQLNKAKYGATVRYDLEQIQFDSPSDIPASLNKHMGQGLALNAADVSWGEKVPASLNVNSEDVIALYGPGAARELVQGPKHIWHGPIKASSGTYFVRVIAEHSVGFEQFRHYVQMDWDMAQSRAAVNKEIDRVQGDYKVIIDR